MCWILSDGAPGNCGGCGSTAMTKAKIAAAQKAASGGYGLGAGRSCAAFLGLPPTKLKLELDLQPYDACICEEQARTLAMTD